MSSPSTGSQSGFIHSYSHTRSCFLVRYLLHALAIYCLLSPPGVDPAGKGKEGGLPVLWDAGAPGNRNINIISLIDREK